MQSVADKALRKGLQIYDQRHGWRGPFFKYPKELIRSTKEGWIDLVRRVKRPKGLLDWHLAIVINLSPEKAFIGFENGTLGEIPTKFFFSRFLS